MNEKYLQLSKSERYKTNLEIRAVELQRIKQKYHARIAKALSELAIEKVSFIGLSEVFHHFIGKGGLKLLEKKGFGAYKKTARGYFKIIKGE